MPTPFSPHNDPHLQGLCAYLVDVNPFLLRLPSILIGITIRISGKSTKNAVFRTELLDLKLATIVFFFFSTEMFLTLVLVTVT